MIGITNAMQKEFLSVMFNFKRPQERLWAWTNRAHERKRLPNVYLRIVYNEQKSKSSTDDRQGSFYSFWN
jgi:hypothetical protein